MSSFKIKPKEKRFAIRGTPIVSGFAMGRAVYCQDIFTQELEIWKLRKDEVKTELNRLQNAVDRSYTDLSDTKEKVASDMDNTHKIFWV